MSLVCAILIYLFLTFNTIPFIFPSTELLQYLVGFDHELEIWTVYLLITVDPAQVDNGKLHQIDLSLVTHNPLYNP